jgi:leader peptidase (prepilin peptidase)/N-methyltransferase
MLFIVLLFGILVGSFLNVCIYRIPRKEDIVYTPSHCMSCGQQVKWYDLVPVFSWLALGGKCRYCKTKLSKQYPIIELSNGAAYMGVFFFLGFSPEAAVVCVLFSALLVASMIDLRWKIIPNGIVIFILIIGIIYLVVFSYTYIESVIGFLAVSVPLLLVNLITKGQMGMGDVKLMAVCGLVIGWQHILLALMIGSIIGSIIGISLIALKITSRKQQIPFGPYLSIGIMIAALFGNSLIQMYLNFIF